MSTLEQVAARNTGAIPVSTAVQGETQLASPKYQVGENLANDVMGVISSKNKAVNFVNEASIEGAKRVAFDKNREMSLYIEEVKAQTNPNDPDSLAAAQERISLRYAELSDVGFALPAAMEAFDIGFTTPTAINVAKINTSLELSKLDLIDEQEKKYVHDTELLNAASGNHMNAEQLNTALDIVTARSGELGRDNESLLFAKGSTNAFDTAVDTNIAGVLKRGQYTDANGLDVATKKRIFENHFNDAYGKINNEGELVFGQNFESELARDEIRRSWDSFVSAMDSSGKNEVNLPLQEYKNRNQDLITSAKEGKSTASVVQKNRDEMRKLIDELSKPTAVSLTNSEIEGLYKDQDAWDIELVKVTKIQNITSGGADTVKAATANGIKWEQGGAYYEADSTYVKNVITSQHEEYDAAMSVHESDKPEFNDAVNKAISLENKSGVKSSTIDTYRDGVTGNGLFENAEQIKKSTIVANKLRFQGTPNSLLKNTALSAALEQLQARYAAGEFKNEQEYVTAANMKMQQLRTGIFSRVESGAFKTDWLKAIDESKDRILHNVEYENSTRDALMYKFVAEGGGRFNSADEMETFLYENTSTFVGSATVFANTLNPFSENATSAIVLQNSQGENLKPNIYEDGIDNLVQQYNRQYPDSTIATSDIRVESVYKGGKGAENSQWDVSIFKDGNLIPIGSYNGDEMTELAAWIDREPVQIENGSATKGEGDIGEFGDEEIIEINFDELVEEFNADQEIEVPVPEVQTTSLWRSPEPIDKMSFQMNDTQENIVDNTFFDTIRVEENATTNPKGGWNKTSKKWVQHKSFEGGSDTIAYGHKLTSQENKTGKILIGTTYYDLKNGLTDNQAKRLFKQDFKKAEDGAQRAIGDNNWSRMSRKNQLLAAEIQFNVRGGVRKFKKFIAAALDPEKEYTAINHIGRKATSASGKTISLTKRTDGIREWYNNS